MSLTLITTNDPRVVSESVTDALRAALDASDRAVMLVPSFDIALQAQRELAGLGGLSMGVTVTTPRGWADERWEVWGTGEPQVSVATRMALAYKAVHVCPEELRAGIPATKGTVSALAGLVRDVLPWLPLTDGGDANERCEKAVWFTEGRAEVQLN